MGCTQFRAITDGRSHQLSLHQQTTVKRSG